MHLNKHRSLLLARYLIDPSGDADSNEYNKNASECQENIIAMLEQVLGRYKLIDEGDDEDIDGEFTTSEHLFQLRIGKNMGK